MQLNTENELDKQPLSALEKHLLNDFQHDFPLDSRPYKKIADDNLNIEIIEEDYTDFISELYLAAEKEGLLRKLQTKIEQITNQLNEKQEYLEFLKEEQVTATEPKIKFGFRKDIKNIETEIQELKEQLKNTATHVKLDKGVSVRPL